MMNLNSPLQPLIPLSSNGSIAILYCSFVSKLCLLLSIEEFLRFRLGTSTPVRMNPCHPDHLWLTHEPASYRWPNICSYPISVNDGHQVSWPQSCDLNHTRWCIRFFALEKVAT